MTACSPYPASRHVSRARSSGLQSTSEKVWSASSALPARARRRPASISGRSMRPVCRPRFAPLSLAVADEDNHPEDSRFTGMVGSAPAAVPAARTRPSSARSPLIGWCCVGGESAGARARPAMPPPTLPPDRRGTPGGSCVSAETGHDVAERRPPSWLEEQVARAGCAAADDDLVGIERVDRVRDADAKPLAPELDYASLSTNTGTPRRSSSTRRSGTSAIGTLTDAATRPVSNSTTDGTPMPTPSS